MPTVPRHRRSMTRDGAHFRPWRRRRFCCACLSMAKVWSQWPATVRRAATRPPPRLRPPWPPQAALHLLPQRVVTFAPGGGGGGALSEEGPAIAPCAHGTLCRAVLSRGVGRASAATSPRRGRWRRATTAAARAHSAGAGRLPGLSMASSDARRRGATAVGAPARTRSSGAEPARTEGQCCCRISGTCCDRCERAIGEPVSAVGAPVRSRRRRGTGRPGVDQARRLPNSGHARWRPSQRRPGRWSR